MNLMRKREVAKGWKGDEIKTKVAEAKSLCQSVA
jgi:hypothetical protein